jgi:hypothetical protein
MKAITTFKPLTVFAGVSLLLAGALASFRRADLAPSRAHGSWDPGQDDALPA